MEMVLGKLPWAFDHLHGSFFHICFTAKFLFHCIHRMLNLWNKWNEIRMNNNSCHKETYSVRLWQKEASDKSPKSEKFDVLD